MGKQLTRHRLASGFGPEVTVAAKAVDCSVSCATKQAS
jgi:hypothetical protein